MKVQSQFIEMLSNSGYEEKSLGELCDKITDGSHNPPKGNDGSEYLMISSKNVFIDGLDLAEVRYLSKEEFDLENKRTEVKKNDILLTIVGTIGRTYLVKGNEGNIVMQRSVAVLKPSNKVNPLFMMYSLHIDENLEKEGRGNAQKGVYLKQLSQFKIKVPSLDVQNNFCTIYQQADKSEFDSLRSEYELKLSFPEGDNIPQVWVSMIAGGDQNLAKQYLNDYVHKLGNLTITGYNSTLSNNSFENKRDRQDKKTHRYIGYRNGLDINKEIAQKETWTIDDITNRTDELVKELLKMYKFPE